MFCLVCIPDLDGWQTGAYVPATTLSFSNLSRESHQLASNWPLNTCCRQSRATQFWEPAGLPIPSEGAA